MAEIAGCGLWNDIGFVMTHCTEKLTDLFFHNGNVCLCVFVLVTENSVTENTPFLNQYAGKINLKLVYGWIAKNQNNLKRGKYYLLIECSVSTKKRVRDISACCRCSLPSWVLVGCNH